MRGRLYFGKEIVFLTFFAICSPISDSSNFKLNHALRRTIEQEYLQWMGSDFCEL
jgi:hypothetical protein